MSGEETGTKPIESMTISLKMGEDIITATYSMEEVTELLNGDHKASDVIIDIVIGASVSKFDANQN